ncbi:hypothetical protein OSL02_22480, partial [Escherichia coli]|nr:hypothetical protein [Escherichia coli]
KRAYCLKIQPATGSFARNLIYSTKPALARKHGRSDCWVGRMLQKAEGVVEGMLMVLDLRLEMDADCSK